VRLQGTLYTSKNATRRWLHCTRRDWIRGAIEQYAPSTRARALEVGPGSGVYLPLLSRMFEEVYAADIESAYLNNLKGLLQEYPNLRLVVDDITASRLPSRGFDLIVCSEVLEHIADSRLALHGMGRLLNPNGVLIISTPQPYSLLELAAKVAFLPGIIGLVRLIYREPILKTGHINLMTSRTVERQLEEAGFRVVANHKSGLYLPVIAELLGTRALRIEKWLEKHLYRRRLDWMLWVQYYVARPAES
jgi:ubiquinone/menaquinone biosynthesis C-methylase UbiE